jgi:bifunctional NMN adenylyltransferase/nudix hydrolase
MVSKPLLASYIGRFSLFHNGHASVALRGLRKYENVLIIVGSANMPRTIKNPWTAEERAGLIQAWYDEEKRKDPALGNLIVRTSRDYPYSNELWLAQTQKIIASVKALLTQGNVRDTVVHIMGAKRDESGFYLDMFPEPTYKLDLVEEDQQVSKFLTATWCREIYLGRSFNGTPLDDKAYDLMMRAFVPQQTLDFLNAFQVRTDTYLNTGMTPFDYLTNEHRVTTERRAEINGKYPPVSLTADAVVIQSGHVLLIRRRSAPGKGLWALPGGYVNSKEWTVEASFRELLEESSIKASPAAIKGSIVDDHWFEHPDRSNINRVITHAFCYKLPDNKVNGVTTLSKVKGNDDADMAQWFPLAEALAMSDVLFDDHFSILEHFIGNISKGKTS